ARPFAPRGDVASSTRPAGGQFGTPGPLYGSNPAGKEPRGPEVPPMSLAARSSFLAALPLLATLAACGGGGGGGGPGGGGGGGLNPPPTAKVAWPPPSALTDEDVIEVAGTATDPDGVQGVTVGLVSASSLDAFKTWEADLPLAGSQTTALV